MAKANFQCVLNKTDNSIDIKLLQQYPLKEQHWILREWFELLGMKMPSQNILERIICEMIGAKENSSPQIKLRYVTLRRYRGKLMAIHEAFHVFKPCEWPHNNQILILSNNTTLSLTPQTKGISKTHWDNARITIKTRQGGEKIRLPNRQGHHDLKKLFQDATIPPWQREVMPLIYLNDKLAAVGNLWIAAEFYTEIDLAYGISLD
jgi:tRNA(Ile)-lysidine synthase